MSNNETKVKQNKSETETDAYQETLGKNKQISIQALYQEASNRINQKDNDLLAAPGKNGVIVIQNNVPFINEYLLYVPTDFSIVDTSLDNALACSVKQKRYANILSYETILRQLI